MGSNWVEYKLDEIAILRNGAGIKQQFFSESSIAIPLVKVSNFTSNSVDVNGLTKVDHEHAQKWISHTLDVEDIVVATVGSWPPNWSSVVGKVVRIPQLAAGAIQNQNTCAINPKDNMDKDFLYYVLKTDSFINYVVNVAQGSANQARVPVKKLGEFKFKAPFDIEKQRQLVNVLVNADKKIELNQKTNQTLEQMAQALFKSWFVDFDPVFDNLLASVDFKLESLENRLSEELKQKAQRRLAALDSLENAAEIKTSLIALAHELQAQLPTKEATQSAVQAAETPVKANFSANPKILAQHANTHAHFPNEFEHNEQLGWIPKGWKLGKIENHAVIEMGQSPKGDTYNDNGLGTPLVNGPVEFGPYFTKKSKWTSTPTKLSQKGDLIVCVRGSTTGRFVKSDGTYCIGRGVCSIRAKSSQSFVDQLFKHSIKEMLGLTTGSTFPNWSRQTLSQFKSIIPSDRTIKLFDMLVSHKIEKIECAVIESEYLTNMRDVLLPKLITGELQIPDVATQEVAD